jgi:hypothetical protein
MCFSGRIQNAAGSSFPQVHLSLSVLGRKKKKTERERDLDAAPRFEVGNRKRKMSDTVFQKRYQRSAESVSEVRVLDSIPTGFGVGRGVPIAWAIDFDGW